MRTDYSLWLAEQKYAENTQAAQIARVKKIEENYGDLENHYIQGTYSAILNTLEYSTADQRQNKKNPSKIVFSGDIRNNLQSYKSAAVRYLKFLENNSNKPNTPLVINENSPSPPEEPSQKLSLERDMQAALRRNITSLAPNLRIIDDGAERSVTSGLIDITCEDEKSIIVIELKAGKADSRAIGQILGYMGDLQVEENDKPIRGILVAHDFDQRVKSAARVTPSLTLKKYSIEFKFTDAD